MKETQSVQEIFKSSLFVPGHSSLIVEKNSLIRVNEETQFENNDSFTVFMFTTRLVMFYSLINLGV